jgi:hypothetical protein
MFLTYTIFSYLKTLQNPPLPHGITVSFFSYFIWLYSDRIFNIFLLFNYEEVITTIHCLLSYVHTVTSHKKGLTVSDI